MISNISFGSTYKVSSRANGFDKFWDFQDFASKKANEKGVQVSFNDSFAVKTKEYNATNTIVVPDVMDNEIERFCANLGIKYKKFENKDLMQKSGILERIAQAPKGMKKVNVDAEKLFELSKNQEQNLEHCKKDYYAYYSDKVDYILKSGDEISATTLWIYPIGESLENTLNYINKFGANNLNNKQLMVEFNQTTDAPDHCVFFALKNLGIKEIPMYVDNDTYKLADALGILK